MLTQAFAVRISMADCDVIFLLLVLSQALVLSP
jgi:hypothetical protein